ncbi:hypothetical protein [Nonomuraea sp. NPDC049646]|uniref:hypothetical protein n=1 Tax=unclassified Nonomuraea TaxID=2593643 RepID=UPI00378CC1AB
MGLPEICLFCRVLIGVVFAVAALGKLRGAAARRAFADSLVPVLSAAGIGRRARHPVAVIAEHGRWAPTSPVVLRYIRAVACK